LRMFSPCEVGFGLMVIGGTESQPWYRRPRQGRLSFPATVVSQVVGNISTPPPIPVFDLGSPNHYRETAMNQPANHNNTDALIPDTEPRDIRISDDQDYWRQFESTWSN